MGARESVTSAFIDMDSISGFFCARLLVVFTAPFRVFFAHVSSFFFAFFFSAISGFFCAISGSFCAFSGKTRNSAVAISGKTGNSAVAVKKIRKDAQKKTEIAL